MFHHHHNQIHSTQDGDAEFRFWGSNQALDYENLPATRVPHQEQEECFYLCSPPLWKTNGSRIVETSPLLQRNYRHLGNVPPRIRSQAIAEGRKELMEIIHKMPESSYELSLKDIVDQQQAVQEEVGRQEARVYSDSDVQVQKKHKKKKVGRSGHISRSISMEKETFLIKTFIPSSLGWKTKARGEKCSRLSPSLSLDESQNQMHKEWWIKRFLVAGEGKASSSSSSSSTSSSSSSRSRQLKYSNTSFSPGCWSFFGINKSIHGE